MYNILASTILLAAVTISRVSAKCSAVGWLNTNSAGFGPDSGTTISSTTGITLFNDDKVVGNYTVCDSCKPVCSDIVGIDSELPSVFEWGATCAVNTFIECHGAYGSQTHIKGDSPQEGNDFYGLGIGTSAECKVEFDC